MKVLDSTVLIDYLEGLPATREFLESNAGASFVIPSPADAEYWENGPEEGDIDGVREDLAWGEVYPVDSQTAVVAAKLADEMGPEGPFLTGMDGLMAAVGRELDVPVVWADGDLTREETKRLVAIEEYR